MDLGSMFPDDMGIGEGDKTVQLVLIYGSIAVLYLVVAYIMFFRSFISGVLLFPLEGAQKKFFGLGPIHSRLLPPTTRI